MLISRSMAMWPGDDQAYHHLLKRNVDEGTYMRDGMIFMSFAIVITMMRTYSRWEMVGWRGFQADDYLVWFAMGLNIGETVNDIKLVTEYNGLTNDGLNAEQRAALSPDSEEYRMRVGGSILHLAAWPIYVMQLWALKAAMAVFYLRLMDHLNSYRRKIHIGFGLISVTFLIVILVPWLSCIPTRKMWQVSPDPGALCHPETSPSILWTVLACNIITDAYLLWLPMPMLFQSTLPKVTKIVLMLLFGCGIFVTAAAIMTIMFVVTRVDGDRHNIGFWAARETFVAILTTNLPCIFVLLRQWLRPSLAFLRTISTSGVKSGPGGGGGGGNAYGAGRSSLAGGPKGGSQTQTITVPVAVAARKSSFLSSSRKKEPGGSGSGSSCKNSFHDKMDILTSIASGSSSSPKTPNPTASRFGGNGLLNWGPLDEETKTSPEHNSPFDMILMQNIGGGGASAAAAAAAAAASMLATTSSSAPPTAAAAASKTGYSTNAEKSSSQESFLFSTSAHDDAETSSQLSGTTGHTAAANTTGTITTTTARMYHDYHRRTFLRPDDMDSVGDDEDDDDEDGASWRSSGGSSSGKVGASITSVAGKGSSAKTLKRGPGPGIVYAKASAASKTSDEIHRAAEGGIQKHVEISIQREPTSSWDIGNPARAYSITRAYKEPAPPKAVYHQHHKSRKP